VEFLGFIVGVDGVKMDPRKVKAIEEWPIPKSYHDLQVFLGFTNFYRGFISHYSHATTPLTDLLKGMEKGHKTGPFEFPVSAERAFQELKDCFTRGAVLVHYNPARQTRVESDASGKAVGGILSQAYEGQGPSGRTVWKPIAFFSRKMNPAELNYGGPNQEMLAIVESFKEWRHYLEATAKPTLVLTDHQNLRYFITTKELNRRQAR
jgi:hypothetical protein